MKITPASSKVSWIAFKLFKVSDEWTVPLCATHHRALHTVGDEER
jgi:hypothetical protein